MQYLEAMVADETGLEWRSRDVDGRDLRFCRLRVQDRLQLSPCYVMTEDSLMLASDVAGLVRALRRDAEESLAMEPDFAEVRGSTAGASGVLHLRSARGIEIGWRQVETLIYPLIDSRSEELGFDSDSLPDSDSLADALGETTWFYTVSNDGVSVRGEGTFALGTLVAALGTVGDIVLERATGKIY